MSVQRNLRLAYAERDYLSDDNEEQEVETPRDAESEPNHDEEDSEFTTPEPVASTLEEAIRLAPPGQLRSILNFLCEKNDFAKGFTSACLIYQPNNDSGRKRKVFAQCKTCGVEYDVVASAGENCIADCRYHPGKKELCEYPAHMVDYDQDSQDGFEKPEDDDDFEQYIWSCCGRLESNKGCHTNLSHVPIDTSSAKRSRR